MKLTLFKHKVRANKDMVVLGLVELKATSKAFFFVHPNSSNPGRIISLRLKTLRFRLRGPTVCQVKRKHHPSICLSSDEHTNAQEMGKVPTASRKEREEEGDKAGHVSLATQMLEGGDGIYRTAVAASV